MNTDVFLLALVVWREAANQLPVGRLGVACVIRNRVAHPCWWGRSWYEVITKKGQFTSMVPPDGVSDPCLKKYPQADDESWKNCLQIAEKVYSGQSEDVTYGATFYYAKSMDSHPPAWAKDYLHTVDLGEHHFYKLP